MISKWFELKPKARSLRKEGKSIKWIEKNLGIPRSTLSGWLKDIKLTEIQRKRLEASTYIALNKARVNAVKWHNEQKLKRFQLAEKEADATLAKLANNDQTIELALALLYLGEGFKKNSDTGMGNSDPLILKFFLKTIMKVYNFKIEKIAFYLHLRYDQDEEKMKEYWAKELEIPISNFKKTSFDKRTKDRETYPDYKGVCLIRCGNVAIQRKLVYIGRKFCEQTINNLRD